MNHQRRKTVGELRALIVHYIEQMEMLNGAVYEMQQFAEALHEEEQESYDNIPLNLKGTDNALDSELAELELKSAKDNITLAVQHFEYALEDITNILDQE